MLSAPWRRCASPCCIHSPAATGDQHRCRRRRRPGNPSYRCAVQFGGVMLLARARARVRRLPQSCGARRGSQTDYRAGPGAHRAGERNRHQGCACRSRRSYPANLRCIHPPSGVACLGDRSAYGSPRSRCHRHQRLRGETENGVRRLKWNWYSASTTSLDRDRFWFRLFSAERRMLGENAASRSVRDSAAKTRFAAGPLRIVPRGHTARKPALAACDVASACFPALFE